ncbi:hypothetical protein [Clostridium beijerinckii]|jgi:ABC-type dipeptide/oligopeptide/nickel transport system permease subunit|uniref:Uncharacterized protein n=2 Tax=Clostridium beijerinckii TaxID=1520 RepID=A0AAE2RS47_CLOBE|nr:hypothetical protein [Clostridium beijerinckii]MBF7810602.1 hypothetical protein [Clostridium beijerinckii]NOW91322.1 ABC-type dipeptide/oligopeptide/nickel transport system permease subunit [Clostridium beijerinckii]NRT23880.1 ABC-type dipeptide/oligopeptide/nickel transport system permease subunit [Clostridium beijerinckii]NRT68537.1 ABC-type dipeptide/oligopeptide/nickel transport system permease subunit [Clostridium beijerinckii]NRT86296.1 ABC-type dipeptide/oligopeptide/nickel transpor
MSKMMQSISKENMSKIHQSMMRIWNVMMIIPIFLIIDVIYIIFKQEEKIYVKVCRVSDT